MEWLLKEGHREAFTIVTPRMLHLYICKSRKGEKTEERGKNVHTIAWTLVVSRGVL